MAKSYSYTIFLKDFMSSKLMKVAQTAGSTYNKFSKLQENHQKQLFKGAKNIDGLRAKLEGLKKQQGTATTIKQLRKINGQLAKTERSLVKLEKLPPNSFLDRIRKLPTLMKGFAGAAIGAVGVMSVWNGFKGVAKLGMDLEQTRIKFETLLGSSDKANKMLANLNKFANKTPFENADLQRNAELLLNFGMGGKKILPTLKMLGDISGGNKEKLNSMTLAYAQMQSTGKLMGQDLLQMINAGFNPLQIISEKTGLSMGKLKEQMSKGQISAKMVESAFATATGKGGRFYGMMDKISQSGWGKLSTFFGNLKTKLAEFSEKHIVPTINKVIDFGIKMLGSFDKVRNGVLKFFNAFKPLWNAVTSFIGQFLGLTEAGNGAFNVLSSLNTVMSGLTVVIEIMSNGIATVLNWIKPLTPVLRVLLGLYGLWKLRQIALNIVMMANPIGLVITGIVALIGTIVYAYQKVGWFRGGILAIWETLKGFGNLIKEAVIDRLKEFIKGIAGIGNTLMLFFKGKWKQAWEAGKQATKNLIGVETGSKALKRAKEIGKNAAKAYHKGVAEAGKSKSLGVLDKLTSKVAGITGNSNAQLTGGGLGNSDVFKQGISGIADGGSKQTNINVQFGKMVETVTIQTETLTESVDEMEDKLKDMLMRLLNSMNQLQTS